MTKHLGQDFRVFVGDGGSPEIFTEVKGQTGLDLDDSSELTGTSSKSDGRIGTQRPGRRSLTVTVSGNQELPDAAGLEAVYDLYKAEPNLPSNFEIRITPFAATDQVFAASMFVANFSRAAPDQDNATYAFDLVLDAAPSVDILDAV